MYDVIIIGAGPAGCRTAELLAVGKKQVLVIEEHAKVGEPVQCTGLISAHLLDIHPDLPKNIVQKRIKTARFFAPNGTNFSLSVKKPTLVVDRKKLDRWLAEKAKKACVSFKLGTKFIDFQVKKDKIIVKTNKGNFETKVLIGADGPLSKVREIADIEADFQQQIFAQKTKTGMFKNEAQLRFGGEYFSWTVPISKTQARVGGVSSEMKRIWAEERSDGGTERRGTAFAGTSGGVMRYGLLKSAQKGNVFLVGDAALQVKPFSCGGVVYGQIGAECLAKSILEDRDYDQLWKDRLAWPIRKGLLLCQFYSAPNWLQSLLIEIIVRTSSEKLLESLDMDFY
jgi:digeranylgeranylglycerophospholipid reductase